MTPSRAALLRRIVAEHRTWVWGLGLLLAVNVAVLLLAILPMSRAVVSAEGRARQAESEAAAAASELKAITATRDGRDAAMRDLNAFYREVLPGDAASARRLVQLRLAQLAREHQVTLARTGVTPESIRDSQLARLAVVAELVGRYDDIRRFLHTLETGRDFVVVDAMVLGEGSEANDPLSLSLSLSTYFKAVPDAR